MVSTLRFAARLLWKSPGFTFAAVATLALVIAVNSAVFSLVNTIVLRPLPFHEPERLIWLESGTAEGGDSTEGVSAPDLLDWRRQSVAFSSLVAVADARLFVTGDSRPERVSGAWIEPELLETLVVKPLFGREFQAEDARPGSQPVALVGYGLWQRRFGGDDGLIGKALRINGESRTVIGIMPRRFRFPEYAEIWLPLALDPAEPRGDGRFSVVGRLAPDASLEKARREMQAIDQRLESAYPREHTSRGVVLTPLRQRYVGETGLAAIVFLALTGLVLLIACTNLASLLLARATSRQQEIALRTALGASRRRVVSQLLTESLLLAALGAVPGFLLGRLGLRMLIGAVPVDLPFWAEFTIDGRVIAFFVGITVLTGVAFGLTPALRASRPDLNEALKVGDSSRAMGSRRRLTRVLVVAEIAIALALLFAAGLMGRGFLALQRVEPGFDATGVLTARVSPLDDAYRKQEAQRTLARQVIDAVRTIGGVQSVTFASSLPMHFGASQVVSFEGSQPPADDEDAPRALTEVVGPGYFAVLDIPLRSGRRFGRSDDERAPALALVNQTFADRFWPDGEALGQRLRLGKDDDSPWLEVVGVVGDVRQRSLDRVPRPAVYRPFAQAPQRYFTLLVETRGDPAWSGDAVRRAVAGVDPDLAVDAVKTLERVVAESLWQPSLYTWLLGTFAVLALVLAVIGVYGVVAYSVNQRTREIGIRIAVGARASNVLLLVVRQELATVVVGLAVGVVVGFLLSGLLASALQGFAGFEPMLPSALALLFLVIASLAILIPARRAVGVDPQRALRAE